MVVAGLSILVTTMWTARSEAHCFSRWYYPWAQRCGGALPKLTKPMLLQATRLEQTTPGAEQITIPLPALDFEACQAGDERLLGIAKLRALSEDH